MIEGAWPETRDADVTYFRPTTREYLPRYSDDETEFMRFLLYDRAKFIPA